MQKSFIYFIFLATLLFANFVDIDGVKADNKNDKQNLPEKSECLRVYEDMQLEDVINYTAFEYAYAGYNKINVQNKDVMTLIDFSKPSTEERFYVLDMQHKKLLFSTYVSHGKRSGENYATSFSNKPGSHKSSPGFFITENAYHSGRNGYSLVLNGLEKGINDKARQRAIVIHGADYCDPSLIESGRLGRSFGCPALPININKPIIDTIKDGTLLYIHANDKNYLSKSKFIRDFLSVQS